MPVRSLFRKQPSKNTFRTLQSEELESRRLLALNPTAMEQEFLQRVNRIRTDPAGEFSRMFSRVSPLTARDSSVQTAVDFFDVNGTTLRNELAALPATHPLMWSEGTYDFAAAHNQRMIASGSQFHSNTLQRRQALLDAGVNLRFASGEKINSENVYAYAESADHLFASYIVDWGNGPGGMQPQRGHRTAIMNPDFEQVGHKISPYSGNGLGPNMNTQVLVNIQDPPAMVGGALFEDKDDSGWYDGGEGIGRATLTFEGEAGTFQTTTMNAGGYQLELPAGIYQVTATGGGMRHPVVKSGVVVSDTNVWQNLIYDPDAIPADGREANNSTATATELSGSNQSLTQLSIHLASDRDYFKLVSPSSGNGLFRITFNNSSGNLDLYLLDSSGRVLDSSTGNGNSEQLQAQLTRDTTYYAMVRGKSTATNGQYTLRVEPPQPIPPVAASDRASAVNATRSSTIRVLDNDNDPDGPNSALQAELAPGTHSAFSLDGSVVQYAAPDGYSGVHRASYTLRDDQGLTATGRIEVLVVDFSASFPWLNEQLNTDVNDDGLTTPSDVLTIINDLNSTGSRTLPSSHVGAAGLQGFVDTNADGFISPIDALLVINLLNSGSGEGEAAPPATTDQALAQLSAFDYHETLRRRRAIR